jgi:geranylgeranyl reductase family protein
MLSADLAIVGCGPAGAAAAISAARAGVRVVVVDRADFPRDKCCGDGLTTGALRRLEHLGFDPRTVPSWQPARAARIRTARGRQAVFGLPDDGTTWVATARRFELDAALVDLARRAGAIVHEHRALTAARLGPDGRTVELDLDDGETVRAWYAIGADGMWSPLRRALGAGDTGYLGEWHAARQYLHGAGPAARDVWVWFEEDLRPGYVWSFPLPDGAVNVGFGVRRNAGPKKAPKPMREQWAELLARPHIASVLGSDVVAEGPIKTWPIPARIGRSRLTALGGRVLFAGDAARAPDGMTGEGIAQALETGELAARTVAAWGPDAPAAAARTYRTVLAHGMVVDNAVSGLFSRVLGTDRGGDRWLDVATAGERTRRQFARWMFEDYPRAGPLTPWRWHLGRPGRPGAFAP